MASHRLLFIIRDRDGTFWSGTATYGPFVPDLREALFFSSTQACDRALQAIRERWPKDAYTIADIDIDLGSAYDARVHLQNGA